MLKISKFVQNISSHSLNYCTYRKAMKAIVVEKFGKPSVLKIQDVALPPVNGSKILIKVAAAGVNPVDTYIREGKFGYLPELPYTPGKDGSGVVEAVGENVSNFKVGDKVFICERSTGKSGTYAEYCLAEQTGVFPLSDQLSFEEGAAIGVPYFTAYRALVLKMQCVSGEFVLVHGASGSVGLATVQLAKHLGLKTIGTAGTEEGMKIVKENGADFVVCHRKADYVEKIKEITNGKGVEIIIEMLANVNLNSDLEILTPRGRIAVVGSRGPTRIDPRSMMAPETSITGIALLSSTEEEWKQTANFILEGIRSGWVKPVIDRVYALEQAAEAHENVMNSKGAKGKLVLLTSMS